MKDFYQKYQGYLPAAFFVGGFLFDLLTTDRIDHSFSLAQQAVYLFIIMIFLYWEVMTPSVFLQEGKFLAKLWRFHVEALHFLFGSLLSLYTIFYFKSSSLMTSFLFMIFLTSLLVINELPSFHKRGMTVRACLFALCLSSYFIYLVPVVTGEIGVLSFVLSMVLSICFFLFLCTRIQRRKQDSRWLNKRILIPGLIVQFIFVILYFFKLLPPVPVSLKYIGIYHDIQKNQGRFVLNYERDWWRFWQSGAQTYLRREGDKVYCFVSVFSPAEFKDQVTLHWYQKGKKGWRAVDQVSLPIVGGRDQGYRGYAYKSNFTSGHWQVRVTTSDDRELGRVSFYVLEASAGSVREWRQDLY